MFDRSSHHRPRYPPLSRIIIIVPLLLLLLFTAFGPYYWYTHTHTHDGTNKRTDIILSQTEECAPCDPCPVALPPPPPPPPSLFSRRLAVAMTLCGVDRWEQVSVLLKSVFLQSDISPLTGVSVVSHVYIIYDSDELLSLIKQQLSEWPLTALSPSVIYINIHEFKKETKDIWFHKLFEYIDQFKRCSIAKMWIPLMIPEQQEQVVLYVDMDTAFVSPMSGIFAELLAMSQLPRAMIGIATETDHTSHNGWYKGVKCFGGAKGCGFDYFLPYGLNAGVLLYNLTRFHSTSFRMFGDTPINPSNTCDIHGNLCDDTKSSDEALSYSHFLYLLYQRYVKVAGLADQDFLNIWLHRQPQYYYPLNQRWNFRYKHETNQLTQGIGILHFAGGILYNFDGEPFHFEMFRNTFRMIRDYPGWSTTIPEKLPKPVYIKPVKGQYCQRY